MEKEVEYSEKIIEIFFALLRYECCGGPAPALALDKEEWVRFYHLANAHDLAHLVADTVQKEKINLPTDIASALEQKQLAAVFRYEQQQYEFQRICSVLEQAEIPYIPLKGILLRNCYPECWMRTSADLDLLVREADLNRAIALLQEQLCYKEKHHIATHEHTLVSPSGVFLELHYNICEPGRANNADAVLRRVWDHAQVGSGCRYVLDDAMFYFYQLAHAAKHIQNGGCGIRAFLDLWLYDRAAQNCDREARTRLIEEAGLSEFEQVCGQLCECWFNGAPLDERTEKLQRYIIDGGTYGTTDQNTLPPASRTPNEIKLIYLKEYSCR